MKKRCLALHPSILFLNSYTPASSIFIHTSIQLLVHFLHSFFSVNLCYSKCIGLVNVDKKGLEEKTTVGKKGWALGFIIPAESETPLLDLSTLIINEK